MRPVKLEASFSVAMDRLSHALVTVSEGFEHQDDAAVAEGYAEFDAAVVDALAALDLPK